MDITDVERVMDEMPYGLYIVGSKEADGRVNGMMADWMLQVSFQPRLVGVAFEQDSHTLANVRERRFFSVNLLAQDDESMELARRFAQPFSGEKVEGRRGEERTKVHYKLHGVRTRPPPTAAPSSTPPWPGSSASSIEEQSIATTSSSSAPSWTAVS